MVLKKTRRSHSAGHDCGKWRENHINFDKAPLIAHSTLSPSLCLPQSKPLIPLQKEEDPETHKTVLTNYMFPQQTRTEDCEYFPRNKTRFLCYALSRLIWQTLKLQMFLTCFQQTVLSRRAEYQRFMDILEISQY